MSQKEKTAILLTEMQYTHIINNNSGDIRLVEGPNFEKLSAEEEIYNGIKNKIILSLNEYAIIQNPFRGGALQKGEQETRKGPLMFSLHPGELLDGSIRTAFSLTKDEGVYIRNVKTGKVRIEIGPKRIFLETDEALFYKQLSQDELNALYWKSDKASYYAININLQKDDIIQLYNKDTVRIVQGPKRVFLGPYERPKLFNLSGDTPKRPGVLIKAKISISPSFISDILSIRTKDNAILRLRVRYKQRIILDQDNLKRVFSINDFIGFAVETLASEIREESAKYDFEEFHSNASEIVKNAIFKQQTVTSQNQISNENSISVISSDQHDLSRVFTNGLEIFGVDIKEIIPEDPEIIAKLNTAISKNMDVYVEKILQAAELEARKSYINGSKAIEALRKELIQLQRSNARKENVDKIKIDVEATGITDKGQDEAKQLILEAKITAENNHVKAIRDAIAKIGADKYLKLLEYRSLGKIEKAYVLNSDDKLSLPLSSENS